MLKMITKIMPRPDNKKTMTRYSQESKCSIDVPYFNKEVDYSSLSRRLNSLNKYNIIDLVLREKTTSGDLSDFAESIENIGLTSGFLIDTITGDIFGQKQRRFLRLIKGVNQDA